MKTRMQTLGTLLPFLALTGLMVTILLAVMPTERAHALAQRVGSYELGVDAPWRMEPRPDESGNLSYGPIPISISIHDANSPEYVKGSSVDGWQITMDNEQQLLRFESIRIVELDVKGNPFYTSTYSLNRLYEVEVTKGNWFVDDKPEDDEPTDQIGQPKYHICKRWNGETCDPTLYELQGSSEWHAVLFYRPRGLKGLAPGIHLRAELTLREKGWQPNLITGEPEYGEYSKQYVQHLLVHHGKKPLPRFNGDWVYGDLHYHSQGTDNDGETAMSYRSLVQTMGAMGLDFIFATEHASNSRQIVFSEIDFIPQVVYDPSSRHTDWSSALSSLLTNLVDEQLYGLRDMSQTRFQFHHDLLNDPEGVNRDMKPLPSQAGRPSVPQVFLGGEVDSIPEVPAGQVMVKTIPFNIHSSCMDLPWWAKFMMTLDVGYIPYLPLPSGPLHACDFEELIETRGDRWLIKDVQGPGNRDFYARQHLLHFPTDGDRNDTFISSDTSRYGGATRRLGELLDQIERQDTGYVFLAHPFSKSKGNGKGRLGPDLVPFSKAQLRDAFASERMIGLQLWNSDTNLWTEMGHGDAKDNYGGGHNQSAKFVPVGDLDAWEHGERQRHLVDDRSVALWDAVQLWGLDPNETDGIEWLATGQPRRMFMAGGSDGHGDYNFRREGYATGTSKVTDTAIGKPRNLVNVGEPMGVPRSSDHGDLGRPYTQTQIVNALRSGEFSVTDGPALRIVFDVNQNGIIDEGDTPMGGVVDRNSLCEFPILVEWKSTPEFGPVKKITLYLGIHSDEHSKGMLYRGWGLTEAPEVSQSVDMYIDESTDRKYPLYNFTNGKVFGKELGWIDPTRTHTDDGALTIFVSDAEKYRGVQRVIIDPEDFPVGLTRIEEVTRSARTFTPTWKAASHAQVLSHRTAQPRFIALKSSGKLGTSVGPSFEDILNPLPPPLPPVDPVDLRYFFDDAIPADRMYIRAVAKGEAPGGPAAECTVARDECIARKAYSNPIWINLDKSVVLGQEATCKNGDLVPKIVSPAPETRLLTTTVTFTGVNTNSGDLRHWIQVGTAKGRSNLKSQSMGSNRSITVSGLPASGPLFVRYWTKFATGWKYQDHIYTMKVPNPPPKLFAPSPGGTLLTTTVTFTGRHTSDHLQHWLYVGTAKGRSNLKSMNMGTTPSVRVSGLPTSGTIYVRYWTRFKAGGWKFQDHTYTIRSRAWNGGTGLFR